jgi:hypothetical protein
MMEELTQMFWVTFSGIVATTLQIVSSCKFYDASIRMVMPDFLSKNFLNS